MDASIHMNSIYDAYGAHTSSGQAHSAYTGQRIEADTGWYLLGERPYSPVLRRFLSPDPVSPFDAGGINRYAYCEGDPINRIDPSGNISMQWLRSTLGLSGGIAASSRGQASDASAGSPGLASSVATPGTMAMLASSTTDVLRPVSTLSATHSSPADNSPGNIVFGRLASDPDKAVPGVSVPAFSSASPGDHYLGQHGLSDRMNGTNVTPRSQRHHVNILEGSAAPPGRIASNRHGKPILTVEWKRYLHNGNPDSSIWVADTTVNAGSVKNLIPRLQRKGVTKVFLYTGVHGVDTGDNWTHLSGIRLSSDAKFYMQDYRNAQRKGKEIGVDVELEAAALLTRDTMHQRLQRSGTHVLGFCFGVADEVFMDAVNLKAATVYRGAIR